MRGTARVLAVVASLLVAGCEPKKPEFGQGSPRPACTSTITQGRTPYALPQVAADAGFGAPVKLGDPINTGCPEDAIEISRDGQTLYFLASPEVNAPNQELLEGTTGVYSAHRTGAEPGAFDAPKFFDLGQGSEGGSYDGELSFTPAGDRVYFHSTRADNQGYRQSPPVDDPIDIYVAEVVNGVPGAAQNLGPPVNSVYLDGEHCLSPDGSKLYLTSTRPGGLGGPDLWVSSSTGGQWSPPVNLGAPIDSAKSDLQPAFAADDPDTLYFASDRDGAGGIFRSRFDGTQWSAPQAVITGYVGEPTLTADGSVMYFVHVSVDDQGVFGADIWYVERQ